MKYDFRRRKIIGLVMLIMAFLILSIVMPFIHTKISYYDDYYTYSQIMLLQSELAKTNVLIENDFGNMLSVLSDSQDQKANQAIDYYRKSAKTHMVGRLLMTYVAFYNENPNQARIDYWNSLNFEELGKLESELTKTIPKSTFDTIAKSKTDRLKFISYILYAFSFICQGIGLFLINLQ